MDPEWLKWVVCPITKAPLKYDKEKQLLISEPAAKAYRIKDGIPILLAEEAIDWPVE
jgi:uncharacterized protein